MGLKIAVGGIEHETNTFCAGETPLSDFQVERGHEIIDNHWGVRTYLGGMLDAAASLNATVVPMIFAAAEPAGPMSESSYLVFVDELLASIAKSLPLDAIALYLHGAGLATKVGNMEVDICRRIRQLVGYDVKLVVTLDLHGNLNPQLSNFVDVAFCVHNHPHTDAYERGQDAINILPRLLNGSVKPKTHIEKLPLLMVTATTMSGWAADVWALCRSIEEDPDIITCTFLHGFPWADSVDTGPSVLVVANEDADKAKDAAKRVARFVWNAREEIRPKALSPEEAIKAAVKSEDWPVVLVDGADCSGAGCPADGTYLLRAMLEAKLGDTCFAVICDPAVVVQAHQAGVGTTIAVALGGKSDKLHGAPITATAYVKSLTDGRFLIQQPMGRGARVSVGKTARLQIDGIDIVVVSNRYQPLDPEIFLSHGIDVSRCRIIGLKSLNHWRAGFQGIVKHDFLADSPGLMSQDLTRFSYNFVPRPVWPFDRETIYDLAQS
ncbi:M81 family metallopeptidase [Mesorhizobium waimense]|uniref:M81 family metallopeptidase n=1 Tax=Mesorhizobium waimense TaxID=1300307 RepID=UPI00142D8050|nr:M81 family metallopeptidase [Mesorhizobium waimense]